jgi:hypothetical protein
LNLARALHSTPAQPLGIVASNQEIAMNQNSKIFPSRLFARPLLGGLACTFLLALGLSVQAQTPAPAAPAPSPAQMLARSQAQLAQAQAKAAAIQEDVLSLDREIDARVDEIVALLKGAKDSTESKTEVMNVKKEAIESLKKWVQVYAQERGRRLGQIQASGSAATRAELQNQVANIDAELNGRVDQIVELAASMSTSEDVERYETYYADWGVSKVETDEYRANKRQVSRADQTQSGVAEELEKAIAGLERDIALVPQRMPRDRQPAELERLQKLLDERRADLRTLATTAYPAEGRPVGDREADQLERDLHYAQEDVRALWSQLLAKANLLSVERQRIRQLDARVKNLAAELPPPAAAPAAPAPTPPVAPTPAE